MLVNLAAIPAELKALNRWVAYGPDPESKKPKCPLLISNKAKRASTRRVETWSPFSHAEVFAQRNKDESRGIGFVFSAADSFLYVDIDDAVDPKGEVRAWAEPFVKPFIGRAYIELSPSGKGLHIIGKGSLPTGDCGGKANFPEVATGDRVPEVAMFASGKYTTITGNVWKGNGTIRDCTKAAAVVWQLAGIQAIGADVSTGPAPEEANLPVVTPNRIPKEAKLELENCSASEAEDRSVARFKLYVTLNSRFEPEEIFRLVSVDYPDWYELSGAAAKGRHHTWADIVRACSKAQAATDEFTEAKASEAKVTGEAAVAWKALGVAVIAETTKAGPVHKAVWGAFNMQAVLEKHPAWKGRLRVNELKSQLEIDGRPFVDSDVIPIVEWVRSYLLWDREPPHGWAQAAAAAAGERNAYHPVRDYLKGLKWDGASRADSWLVRVGGEDSDLTRLLGSTWLRSLVARALAPGCKVDTVLILEGNQGPRKSTLFSALAGPGAFTDSHITLDKDGLMVLQGHWIVELAELSTFRKAEQNSVKQFLSSREDTFRPPYGRTTVTRPRHFVIVGSTNDAEYLNDPTGARRYWPVRIASDWLDVEWLRENRDQLLAEAVARVDIGPRDALRDNYIEGTAGLYCAEPWWFKVQPEALAAAQESRYVADALEDDLGAWLAADLGRYFTTAEAMQALALPAEKKDIQMRVGTILRKRGYLKTFKRVGEDRKNLWHLRPDLISNDKAGEVRELHPARVGTEKAEG